MTNIYDKKVYVNRGNPDVILEVGAAQDRILDIGCGAGDNARILKQQGKYVVGLTISPSEAALAREICDKVLVADIENPDFGLSESFNCVIMSHVCEHLRDPESAIAKLMKHLTSDGRFVIAVPNMAFYKLRFRLLAGNWKMEETGPFDRTHLHFYSYDSASDLCNIEGLQLIKKIPGQSAAPLWPLRKLFPSICRKFDKFLGNAFPNLFAIQTVLVYERNGRNAAGV